MDAPDFSDMDNENAKTPLTLLKKTWFTNYVGIIPDYRAIEISTMITNHKEYEDKILGAEERILSIETRLYMSLVEELGGYIRPLQKNAEILSKLDVLSNFASISARYGYNRPAVEDSDVLDIKEGRHPVIERQLPVGEQYIANDLYLDTQQQQIIMITGPNMAGKSALLRQTALIVLMAQIGCYVPAASAKVGMVDKIFTRVGASDDLATG
mgnify:CR=1 FL=1